MIVREATSKDVSQIVDIHCDAFNGFFLTSLGPVFLNFYYDAFIRNKETGVFCAVEEDKVLGFSAVTKHCKGFNSRLLKENLFCFGWVGLKLMFTNPNAILRLVKNFTKKSEAIEDNEDYAELYSIGVSKKAQGKGIGKKLLAVTEDYLIKNGVDKVSLTTDFYNNESTVAFYNKMGYHTLYDFVAYPNRKMYRLIKTLKKREADI